MKSDIQKEAAKQQSKYNKTGRNTDIGWGIPNLGLTNNNKISFILDGEEVGVFCNKDGIFSFTGNADESAKIFVDCINKHLKENLQVKDSNE